MKFRFITMGAVAIFASLNADSQTAAPAPATAPATTPAQTTLPTPVMPSGQPQRQGLQPNQLSPNATSLNGNSAASGATGNVQDIAGSAADQAILAQVRQTVVARVQGVGSWAPVHFQVQDGVVTILGSLPTAALQQQVMAAVQQTPGVVNVINGTTTTGSSTTTAGAAVQAAATVSAADQSMLLRVRQAVVPQIQVGGMPVPVEFNVQQGVVTLNGTVPTLAEKRQIVTLVQQVPGVVRVNDLVQVNAAASNIQGATIPAAATGLPTESTTVPGSSTLPNNGPGNNLTPTGRTTGGVPPPVLAPRTDLPPGLQRQTPPGISVQTNSP